MNSVRKKCVYNLATLQFAPNHVQALARAADERFSREDK